jgi:hypothetical protein
MHEHPAFHPFEIQRERGPAREKARVPTQLHQRRHGGQNDRDDDNAQEELFLANLHVV